MNLLTSLALGGLLSFSIQLRAQYQLQLTPKVTLQTSVNLETYLFVEKLAVEHIQNFVF